MNGPTTTERIVECYWKVRHFWHAFRQPYKLSFADSTADGLQLSGNLIAEEFNELLNATNDKETLDAYCDLLYVILGGMQAAGISAQKLFAAGSADDSPPVAPAIGAAVRELQHPSPCERRLTVALSEAAVSLTNHALRRFPRFFEAFQAVHAANMQKHWTVPSSDENHENMPGVGPYSLLLIVKRKSDGKIIKPPDFQPPDLSEFIGT